MDPTILTTAVVIANSEAGKILAKGAVDGAGALLSRLLLPGADVAAQVVAGYLEEFRRKNLASIEAKAKPTIESMEMKAGTQLKLPQSLGIEIMDSGSKVSDDTLQDMWAGLLTASCTPDGTDDSNLQFVHIVSTFSPQEARVFKWVYEHCPMIKDSANRVLGAHFEPDSEAIMSGTLLTKRSDLDASIVGLANRGLFYRHMTAGESIPRCVGLSILGTILSLKVQGINEEPSAHFKDIVIVGSHSDRLPQARWG